jgi:hypothetical protein
MAVLTAIIEKKSADLELFCQPERDGRGMQHASETINAKFRSENVKGKDHLKA